ncbi:MAG: type III toxin-antitoxin system ToxN/AbiQ family toxin [Mollicutes bacterium]|nr:type III toxin-antitoxin system ToxN/AbiQ family toxin [Mollicutes bacterium]
MSLKFYEVNIDYVNLLKEKEKEKRGVTKIPNIEYENSNKFLCGVVMQVDGLDYFAPVSSNKQKFGTSILITDNKGEVKSSIRFSFMFPVPKNLVTPKDFSKLSKSDYSLVVKEAKFCKKNSEKIETFAKKIYSKYNKYSKFEKRTEYQENFLSNCGDFKLYEEICKLCITKEKEQEEKKKQIKKNDNIKQKTSFNDIKKNIAEYRKSKKENSENLINKKSKNKSFKIEH